MNTLALLTMYVILVIGTVLMLPTRKGILCNRIPLELHEERASVVITGHVTKILNSGSDVIIDNEEYSASIQIKRVFKGNDLISKLHPSPDIYGNSLFVNYNKKIKVHGFRTNGDLYCVSDVIKGDTKIFFLDYNSETGILIVNPPIVPLSVYDLDRVGAAVKNIPFDVPPPTKSPCLGHFCAFYATCLVNETVAKPYCACVDNCEEDLEYPVCGSDGRSHTSECKLRLASCHRQRRIKIRHEGSCQDPCAEKKCDGEQVCRLDADRQPVCKCEVSCDPVISTVCGSDGQTYSNLCMLRQQSCQLDKDITVIYDGKCRDTSNPCNRMECDPNQDCLVDNLGQAACVCPSVCPISMNPVCGTDGVTYVGVCHLRRQACVAQSQITVLYYGKCASSVHPVFLGPENENQAKCLGHVCPWDGDCVVRGEQPDCECPRCYPAPPFDPVCGVNAITYDNDCKRRQENCLQHKNVKVEHRGLCLTNCNKDRSICKHYSICEVDDRGHPRCVCPTECAQTTDKVCGTDGVTYTNQCELRVASCVNQTHIEIATIGDCEKCNGIQCKYGSRCEQGVCVCPQVCPNQYEPLCATDGKTYRNRCELKKAACRTNEELDMVRSGDCDDFHESGSGEEGSGALQDCDDTNCRYGGTCQVDFSGSMECKCSFSCDAIRSPVCGSNGVTFGNKCELQAEKCRQQLDIFQVSMDSCDGMDEILCDGLPPVLADTGNPYTCTGGHECPSGSYCHLQFGRCCSEEVVSDNAYIRDCSESKYGCCDDQVTSSPSQNKAGCPDMCQCYLDGSLSRTCDPITRQCTCKQGVGGTRCDRCLPRYWGLHLINEQDRPGCMPCNCEIGSKREDCDQNTGRCACYEGYDGHKCGRCSKTGYPAGSHGCDGDATATPIPTLSRKTPRHIFPNKNLTNMTPKRDSTIKPPIRDFSNGQGRIDDLCEEDSYCPIPHSRCVLALCKCDPGYISTHQSTVCSKVDVATVHTDQPELDTCSMDPNPCRHGGICKLDDNLGYRCLCALGRTGVTCNQRTSFRTPSFSGSAHLMLTPLGNMSGDFNIDITFRTFNMDGILLFASQRADGTGQFVSLAINDGQVEFRYDTGSGPKQIRHPQVLTKDKIHKVVAKKKGYNTMIIVDDKTPIAAVTLLFDDSIDLSGKLFLGYLPQNMSFIQEKIGVNLGFVGCVQSLDVYSNDRTREYDIQHPGPSDIMQGFGIEPCDMNACKDIPCRNGGTCIMLLKGTHQCICRKGYKGSDCEESLDICTDSPCHSSATCSLDDSGEIICHCPGTREGQYCEYEKLPETEVPEFHGDSYLILPVSENLSQQTSIEIWFMTREENGMLIYASQYLGGKGDYISLNIVDLSVELRFNLGNAPVIVRSTQKLKIGNWHRVSLKRILKKAELTIDGGVVSTGESEGTLTELQFPGSLNIGGYKDKFDVPPGSAITSNLSGVIQRIYINGRLIEEPISSSLDMYHVTQYKGAPCNMNPCMNGGICIPRLDDIECKCTKRYYGQLCEKVAENRETSQPVRFVGSTYLTYSNEITTGQKSQKLNKLQFQFRTHQSSGMLMFQGDGINVAKDYLAVAISDGYVELSYNLGSQSPGKLLRSRSSVNVSDGEWHTVHVEREEREGMLQVDKEPMITAESDKDAMQLNTDGLLWIGGKSELPRGLPGDYYRGFKGCLGKVFVLDKELHLYNDRHEIVGSLDFCNH